MSSRSLPKKLFHANNYKKAWKIFKTTTIQTKLNISTTLKRTKKYCSSAFTFLRCYFNNIPRKLQYPSSRTNHFQYYRQQNKCRASFSVIYIDELFPGQNRDNNYKEKAEKPMNGSGNSTIETGETSSGGGGGAGGSGGGDSYGRKLAMFRGVDERAEEFITKIREEMKLEREKSIIDFQEMLARSS